MSAAALQLLAARMVLIHSSMVRISGRSGRLTSLGCAGKVFGAEEAIGGDSGGAASSATEATMRGAVLNRG